jgi:hypothetical protein
MSAGRPHPDVHALGSTFGPVDTVFAFAGLLFVVTALVVWGPVSRSSPSNAGSSA